MTHKEGEYASEQRETIAQTDNLRVRVLTLAQGQNVPWHYHNHITDTFFCMEGPMQVKTRLPNEVHVLNPGGTLAVSPGIVHYVCGVDKKPCKFMIVQGVGQYDYIAADEVKIRRYNKGEEQALWELFQQTVKNINNKDYSAQQIDAWAGQDYDEDYWVKRIQKINPFVAMLGDDIVGYADLQDNGYIDHFFSHHLHQRKGIGKALLNHLIDIAQSQNIAKVWANVSETARPFFIKHGFKQVKAKSAQISGQILTNYLLERHLSNKT